MAKEYIEREVAVMTAMNYDGNGNAQDASQDIASVLGGIPAADVAPIKRGTWIGIDDFPYEDFECSCCGAQMFGDDKIPQEMHYCPNCGAKMEAQDG